VKQNFFQKIKNNFFDNKNKYLTIFFLLSIILIFSYLYIDSLKTAKENIIKNKSIEKVIIIKQLKPLKKIDEENFKNLKKIFLFSNGIDSYIEYISKDDKKEKIKTTNQNLKEYKKELIDNGFLYLITEQKEVSLPSVKNYSTDVWSVFKQKTNKILNIFLSTFNFIIPIFFLFLIVIMVMWAKKTGLFSNKNKFDIVLPKDISKDFNDIIGYKDVKEELLQVKEMFENREEYKKAGLLKNINIMLSGPAGTGKTFTIQALAKELNIPLISASGSNMVSMYQGSGSGFIKTLFKEARKISKQRKSPVIVFLDEGQDILKDRSEFSGMNVEERTGPINQLLQELDGVSSKDKTETEILFIVASNFDGENMNIDSAVDRRISKKIKYRLPNEEERINLIKYNM